jgi:adenosine deaminase
LISGVAIAGDETACTIRAIAPVLARFKDAGLGIEIHAGEMAGPESVWDAIEHGRPDRIGHGLAAFSDPRLLETLAARNLHLELCPTSNLRLGFATDIRTHPIVRARELGLSFSVNTDDPGPFDCTLTSELELLERELGFTAADFERIRINAEAARFRRV